MALHLILGNSGAGKSHYLYEHILSEAGRHPERTYYVLVPEQFTMATQREFVRRQENHAILNVDVLSFKRLAYRVFEELGKNTLQVLEDTGKAGGRTGAETFGFAGQPASDGIHR